MSEETTDKLQSICQYMRHRSNVDPEVSWRISSDGHFAYIYHKLFVERVISIGMKYVNAESDRRLIADVEGMLKTTIHQMKVASREEKPVNTVIDHSPLIIEFSLEQKSVMDQNTA